MRTVFKKASSIMLLLILSLLSFGLFVALSLSSEESIKLISCNLYIRVVSRPLPPTLVLAESRAFRDYTLDEKIDKEEIKLTKTNHRPLAQAVNPSKIPYSGKRRNKGKLINCARKQSHRNKNKEKFCHLNILSLFAIHEEEH
uniref:Uncharacterized protein n=1 Tax=Glossina palpalis gambiensis TaxID=67801 RepID=A0A1B0AYS1_9MUSC